MKRKNRRVIPLNKKVFLTSIQDIDFDKDVAPFMKNGVIIDTVVVVEIIKGLVDTRISKKPLSSLPEYDNLIKFLDFIKARDSWHKFFITPHILTEVCRMVRNDYSRIGNDYKKIVEEVMLPILEPMNEIYAKKNDFIKKIELKNPRLDSGDISIYVVADDYLNKKQKIAVLSCDGEMNSRFKDNTNVMVMDYKMIMLNIA